jgi:Domain of unknown function (DUF4124)
LPPKHPNSTLKIAGQCLLSRVPWLPLVGSTWGLAPFAVALAQGGTPGIYVCVDAKGRRLVSDQPIPECLDREQREVSASGVTRRVVPASQTPEEQKRLQAKAAEEAAQRAKASEGNKRDRALLSRYPNADRHNQERASQLVLADQVIASIQARSHQLAKDKAPLDSEMEFYQAAPSKAPAWLQRKMAEHAQRVDSLNQMLVTQQREKDRINARFDEELERLRGLWGAVPGAPKAK